jgi:hypothetical protein
VKKAIGVAVAIAALGAALAATTSVEKRRLAGANTEAVRAASGARQRAADAVTNSVKKLEIRVSAAATLAPLTNQLLLLTQHKLEGSVARTLRDWFTDEQAWMPFRQEFPIYGLSLEGSGLAFLEGIESKSFFPELLVQRGRERGLASDLVMGQGRPYVAAASALRVAGLSDLVVLLLARPLDAALLNEAGERAGAALLLTDGRKVLAQSGAKPDLDQLQTAIGKESSAGTFAEREGTWAASVAMIAPNLWLWAHARTEASARAAQTSATTVKAFAWSAALVTALLSLWLGLRSAPSQTGGPVVASGAGAAATAEAGSPMLPTLPTLPPGAPAPFERQSARPSGLEATLLAAGAVPDPRAAAARSFGRYLLVDRLGEGGMSQVYTAMTYGAEGFRRRFVVKRLRPELVNDSMVVAQFIDEANLASSLVHSNIVPVFDFGKVGDEYFLAQEYILGRDLGRIVRRVIEIDGGAGRGLAQELVLFCAHETLKALEHAHTKRGENGQPLGIVHRDVSPSNILVSARGEVKLFDFGIVKAEGRVTKTQHGVVKGNVSFMSPEQARGHETDARSDLFSLGLVMFHCLTGDVLYHGTTSYELLVKAAAGPDAEERARIGALPSPAAALVARALEPDPARRFASAAEFAAAIAPLLHVTASDLESLMQRLFAAEFREEELRFSAAMVASGGAAGGHARASADLALGQAGVARQPTKPPA